jgi:hypothetical protein
MRRPLTRAQHEQIKRLINGQAVQTKWNSYYSRCRISSTSISSYSYLVAAGTNVTAFGYGKGQDMAAGGQTGTRATPADTNISQPNQTSSGETVIIEGISIILLSSSDFNLAKQLDQNVSVTIITNNQTSYLLGIPSMIPACGGLYGAGEAWSVLPSLGDALSRNIGCMSNGIPHQNNFFPLPEAMVWAPAGQGDSQFGVVLNVEHAVGTIAQFSGTSRSATTGVQAYTPPTAAQCFVDYMVVLIGQTMNPQSSN